MIKQKYFFNNLLLRYRKCMQRLERLKLNGSNQRRQSILEKHLIRLENQLRALFQKINRKVIATAMIAGVALLSSADMQAQISYGAQQVNPFSLTVVGPGYFYFNPIDFADLDDDGDLDMISAGYLTPSEFFYYENTGTATSPTFAASQSNPFSLAPGTALGKTPRFVDIDGDGDFDILAQSGGGNNFLYYENVGTPTAPSFGAETMNPFGLAAAGTNVGTMELVDLDNDGDLDILSGAHTGMWYYFENVGTVTAPNFGAAQTNPFNLTNTPNYSSPGFADLDSDGDFDLLSGSNLGGFDYFENIGTSSTPDFTASVNNPFSLTAISEGHGKPTFVDLDNDGDMDIMSGSYSGNFYYFENTTPIGVTNDECAGATPVACGETVVGTTADNTDTGGFNDSLDEWYSFTGTAGDITVSLCDGGTDYDSLLSVYDACGGTQIAINDDACGTQSELTFTSDGTTTYYIAVEGFNTSNFGNFSLAISCPVTNDECAGATPVACGETVVGTTADNTDTGGNAAPDEWYSFTGTGTTQMVTLSLCDGGTDYDSLLRVFDACGGNEIAANDDACGLQSEVSFQSDGTTTYYVMVEGFGSNAGNFSLEVTCVDPLPNDECAGALDIACGQTVVGETNTASFDATAPVCVTGITAPGVWYTFTDDTGLITNYTLSMCDGGTDYDSKITVYSGDCGALACVVDNDDTCGLQSEVAWQGDGSTTYYVLVHGFGANTGNFSLALACTPVPPPNDMIANSIDVDEIGFPYTDPAVAMPAATTEAGNPAGCSIDGANGVWYNFVPDGDGFATATIITPAGASFVNFFTADSESATEDELTLVDFNGNQCAPQTDAIIPTTAGQAYYVFVVNTDGITDIVIDGNNLGTNDNAIQGFTYYPNPATDVLNLNAIDTIDNVAIYNILGQQVLNEDVAATSGTLDVSNLAVGVYIMKVSVNGQIGTYKIIKK